MKKYLQTLALISILGNVFFIGIYCDWSDGDLSLFVKKKPTLQMYFWSPEKFYRLNPKELSPEEIILESRYKQFCRGYEKQGGLSRIPLLWLQLTISLVMTVFFASGVLIIKCFTHFFLSLWVTPILLIVCLLQDNKINIACLLFLAILINIGIMKLLNYKL